MAIRLTTLRRLDAEFSTVIATALQLIGIGRGRTYKGDMGELFAEPAIAAVLTDDDRGLIDLAWRLIARRHLKLEEEGEERMRLQVASLLSGMSGRLLDATPVSAVGRLSVAP